MKTILHRVKAFVFQFEEGVPQYLVVKSKPSQENFFGPVLGTIQPWENPLRALHREVREETGLDRHEEILDLEIRDVWSMGEEHLVDWMYGVRVPHLAHDLRLGDTVSEYRWVPFSVCYETLHNETNRRGLIRLHTMLDMAS